MKKNIITLKTPYGNKLTVDLMEIGNEKFFWTKLNGDSFCRYYFLIEDEKEKARLLMVVFTDIYNRFFHQ